MITWRHLQKHIEQIPEDHLDDTVTVYLSESDEYFGASNVYTNDGSDVIGDGESYIAIST